MMLWMTASGLTEERCRFLLDSCKDGPQPLPTPPPAKDLGPACGHPHGDYVIVGVSWRDADNGLLVRATPSNEAQIRGVIPANGTGIGVSNCQGSWCQVKYACQSGWAGSRYLAERSGELQRVTGVSPTDPEGLNVREGPGSTFPRSDSIPFNATGVIKHTCQPSPVDRVPWCLVTYRRTSGWVAGRYLTR
jgi:uncharacterized protein YraI